MKIMFLQSADAVHYRPFLDVTSATIKEYCARHGTEYEAFIGLKRGIHPWQAALNRIPILKGHVDQGFSGWIIYMDADSYIADLDFDLRTYLSGKADYAMIAAPSGVTPPRWWDVNNGVVAFNLTHPLACDLIGRWHDRLAMNSDEALAGEGRWSDVVDDQHIFHESLMEIEDLAEHLFRDDGADAVFNWNNRFIRQRVRLTGTMATRLSGLKEMVDEVIGSNPDRERHTQLEAAAQAHANSEFVGALYTVVLGREPDQGGFDGVMRALKRGERTYAQELGACLESPEFRGRLPQFILDTFGEAEVRNLIAHLNDRLNPPPTI